MPERFGEGKGPPREVQTLTLLKQFAEHFTYMSLGLDLWNPLARCSSHNGFTKLRPSCTSLETIVPIVELAFVEFPRRRSK